MDHYIEILTESKLLDYSIYSFSDWINSDVSKLPDRTIILRHDIDVSVDSALTMAEIEVDYGVTSTFFCRLHSSYYNLRDAVTSKSMSKLSTISEIGLHYERMYYDSTEWNNTDLLMKDREEIRRLLGVNIRGCAAHLPGKNGSLDEEVVKLAGFDFEAYADRFVKDRKYISDSGSRWREGCLCEWLGKESHLTVLIHPVWWTGWHETKEKVVYRLGRGD